MPRSPSSTRVPSPLVTVAHRLPIRRIDGSDPPRFEPSPGGVAGALSAVLRRHPGGAWVGWDGTADGPGYQLLRGRCLLDAVPLSEREVGRHYDAFANGCLWPLYHGGLRPLALERSAWEHHVRVNQRFARTAAALCARGGSIWVHDYQLQLVPGALRALGCEVRVGFFLHVPFPEPERFIELPWREELVAGILGADLVGFQTERDLRHFCRTAELIGVAMRESATRLRSRGRVVRVGAFPISIDAGRFAAQAALPATRARAQRLRAEHRGRRVLLGVDRLDYTKGLDARLAACERLWAEDTLRPSEHVLLQVAVPTRESHPHYAALRREIEAQAARIRERHGPAALRLSLGRVDFEELVALYRAADVLLVTPYADGMNLVAKEFVASRIDDTGVLVLSRFAGAAEALPEAIQVDPRNVGGLADAISRALALPSAEARRRMMALRRRVMRADVHDWADRFLDALRSEPRAARPVGAMAASPRVA